MLKSSHHVVIVIFEVSADDLPHRHFLPSGADQTGLELVSGAPRSLSLPDQVCGGVVDATAARGPDLRAERTGGQNIWDWVCGSI